MTSLESNLLPGLKDEVLLDGLRELRILKNSTLWIVNHGRGMELPLGPDLPQYQFTSYSSDKRARTDFLSMYDYMARVYVPKPSDMHPKPHAKVGASEYQSMLDYILTEHRAQVKRRSRRVYERPSVIYKRGLPPENKQALTETLIENTVELVQAEVDITGEITLRSGRPSPSIADELGKDGSKDVTSEKAFTREAGNHEDATVDAKEVMNDFAPQEASTDENKPQNIGNDMSRDGTDVVDVSFPDVNHDTLTAEPAPTP